MWGAADEAPIEHIEEAVAGAPEPEPEVAAPLSEAAAEPAVASGRSGGGSGGGEHLEADSGDVAPEATSVPEKEIELNG